MKTKISAAMIFCVVVAVLGLLSASESEERSHKLTSVSIRKLADSVHAVISADRQMYVELLEMQFQAGAGQAIAIPKEGDALPGHAQMLRMANQRIQQRGAEFSYVLRSLWPIRESNGPQTEVEEIGLESVARNGQPFYTEEELGGRAYFTAIYPDRATLGSCVHCHNQNPLSPRRDFRPNDVMGAIVVRVPLEF
jgi:hypothetical protein